MSFLLPRPRLLEILQPAEVCWIEICSESSVFGRVAGAALRENPPVPRPQLGFTFRRTRFHVALGLASKSSLSTISCMSPSASSTSSRAPLWPPSRQKKASAGSARCGSTARNASRSASGTCPSRRSRRASGSSGGAAALLSAPISAAPPSPSTAIAIDAETKAMGRRGCGLGPLGGGGARIAWPVDGGGGG